MNIERRRPENLFTLLLKLFIVLSERLIFIFCFSLCKRLSFVRLLIFFCDSELQI